MLDLGLRPEEMILYALVFNFTEIYGAYTGSLEWSGRWIGADEERTKELIGGMIRRGLISCTVSGGKNNFKALCGPSAPPRAR